MRPITLPRLTISRCQIKRTLWIREIIACNLPFNGPVSDYRLPRPTLSVTGEGSVLKWNVNHISINEEISASGSLSERISPDVPPSETKRKPTPWGWKDEGQNPSEGKGGVIETKKLHVAAWGWQFMRCTITVFEQWNRFQWQKTATISLHFLRFVFCFLLPGHAAAAELRIHQSVTDVQDTAWSVIPSYLIRITLFSLNTPWAFYKPFLTLWSVCKQLENFPLGFYQRDLLSIFHKLLQ